MKITKVSHRKQPKQERSKLMIQLIIEATTRILHTQGYEQLTTNKVAKKAGISIGSFYQYFSNKESLVLAVILKIMQEDAYIFEQQFLYSLDLTQSKDKVGTIVKIMVKKFFDLHSQQGKLRAEVYGLIFKLGASNEVLQLREALVEKVCVIIHKIFPQKTKEEIQSQAFVVFYACLGVMQGLVLQPEIKPIDVVELQLTRMISDFLLK